MTSTMSADAASPSPPPSPPSPQLATEDFVKARIAELEARLTWWLLGIAAAIVAAVKFIPPAY